VDGTGPELNLRHLLVFSRRPPGGLVGSKPPATADATLS
jgi:hypothetical protein